MSNFSARQERLLRYAFGGNQGRIVAQKVSSISTSVFLGSPEVSAIANIVAAVAFADGALTVITRPDLPRNLVVTLTDGDSSVTAGTITITGLDSAGNTIIEVFTVASAGGTQTLTGSRIFATVASAVVSDEAGAAGGDLVAIGSGDVIGLGHDLDSADEVTIVNLGASIVASPVIVTGEGTSGIDASADTYNAIKVLHIHRARR